MSWEGGMLYSVIRLLHHEAGKNQRQVFSWRDLNFDFRAFVLIRNSFIKVLTLLAYTFLIY